MKRLITTADFLKAFSEGQIGWKEAADGIGVVGRRNVIVTAYECGFGPILERRRDDEESRKTESRSHEIADG